MREPQVIVIGGSLSGCRAALTLAEHGIRVRVLEKARFPRWKPCAGGVSRKARELIPEELQRQFQVEIHGARLDLGARCSVHIRSRRVLGWMVHRERFDEAFFRHIGRHLLIETQEGCEVRHVDERDGHVSVTATDGTYLAEAVIGADGITGPVARCLNGVARPAAMAAYEEEVTRAGAGDGQDFVIFDFAAIGKGYGWVFPKRDHNSVGSYVYRASGRSLKRQTATYRDGILPGADVIRAKGYGIPWGGGGGRLHGVRTLLVGDAAGLVDPLTGEGIYYALRSGHIAARCMVDFLRGRASLAAYTGTIDREIRSDFRIARLLAHFIYRHPALAYHVLFRNALVCRWFAEILTGEMGYRLLLWKLLTQMWRLPFRYAAGKRVTI